MRPVPAMSHSSFRDAPLLAGLRWDDAARPRGVQFVSLRLLPVEPTNLRSSRVRPSNHYSAAWRRSANRAAETARGWWPRRDRIHLPPSGALLLLLALQLC